MGDSVASSDPDDLGIDGYTDATRIGQGGFGSVYRCRQVAFDRFVAIKVLAASGLLWTGDRAVNTVAVQLRAMGLDVTQDAVALTVAKMALEDLRECLRRLVSEGPADGERLAATIENKWTEKYDRFLWDELLCAGYASKSLDTQGAFETLKAMPDLRL